MRKGWVRNKKTGSWQREHSLEKKISKKTKRSTTRNISWSHCSNKECKDYSEMYRIPNSALNRRVCIRCKEPLKKAKIKNGRPVMPVDGTYSPGSYSVKQPGNLDVWGKKNEQTSSNNFSTSTSTSSKSSEPRGTFDKFTDGDLDLATAFWAFGVFGSIIVGVVCGVLAEMVHKFFNFPYVMITLFIIVSLGQCAENHKKVMTQQKKSVVWGVLTQVYCVLGILGLIRFIFDIFGK